MNIFASKIKEVLFTVLPVVIIVLLLNFTFTPLRQELLLRFLTGTVLVILGLTFFLIGVDIGVMPFGKLTGKTLAQKNKLWLIIAGGLVLGFFISVAEPGLLVLANQVETVTSGQITGFSLLIIVSAGLAVMIAAGFIRTIFNISLRTMLLILYGIILVLSILAQDFIAIAFDASGATTGVLAVPFILALSIGISSLKKDSLSSEESSFGLVALASTGAIISVLLINIILNTKITDMGVYNIESSGNIFSPFISILPDIIIKGLIAMSPLLVIYIIMQFVSFKLDKIHFFRIIKGFLYTLIGLIIFLLGVNAAFMEVGAKIGELLAVPEYKTYILLTGFAIGFFTVMAEPAVYVLTHQIEDVTSGYIKRKTVLFSLALGVGIALLLSVLRIIIPELQLWYYLLPGYIIAFILSFFVPKLFVGIAFDGGVVATGPITATFIMAFIQGAANAFEGASLLTDGFGMIAMVALFPIIALQVLGIIYKIMSKKAGIQNEKS